MLSKAAKYSTDKVEDFIKSVSKEDVDRYLTYWASIKPRNHFDYYLRWIFAFMSIHTTWKKNVDGYLEFKKLPTDFTWIELQGAVRRSKTGLDKMRTHAIYEFHKRFWAHPGLWYPHVGESMVSCRNRLAFSTYGIGLTKTAFVLEMAFPATCSVVCLDTHILRLYDHNRKGSPSVTLYGQMENHWLETCKKYNVPSPMVRHIYWDRVQKKEDTRYWSYVLEVGNQFLEETKSQ